MRNERYRDILPIDRLSETACTIIGVGAIGRQVGLQLAAMGIGKAQLIDFDRVEEANLGTQAYLQDDVGRFKVHATADLMQQLNHQLPTEEINERFAQSMDVSRVVFCCVDSIQTREHIWRSVRDRLDLFIDGRMAAEVLRVFTVKDSISRERYPKTLFAQEDAYREACTARATIYCANVAAGIMVGQFAKWMRGLPTDFEVNMNLLATEITVA